VYFGIVVLLLFRFPNKQIKLPVVDLHNPDREPPSPLGCCLVLGLGAGRDAHPVLVELAVELAGLYYFSL